MSKFKLPIIAAALCCVMAAPTRSHAQLPIEEIALSLLGDRFGIAPEMISGFLGRSGMSVFDAAPYYSTSYYTDEPVDDVWELRRQGLGWGQIAHRLGMHPGEFNKLRKSGAFDRDEIWEDIYEDRYGMRESDWHNIRRSGGSIRDALPAVIIARSSRVSPVTVYQRFRSGRDWNRTATYYKTNLRDYRRFAAKSTRPAKASKARVTKVTRAKAKSAGKARAHRSTKTARPARAKSIIKSSKRINHGGARKVGSGSKGRSRGGVKAHGGGGGKARTSTSGRGKSPGGGGGKSHGGQGKGGGKGRK